MHTRRRSRCSGRIGGQSFPQVPRLRWECNRSGRLRPRERSKTARSSPALSRGIRWRGFVGVFLNERNEQIIMATSACSIQCAALQPTVRLPIGVSLVVCCRLGHCHSVTGSATASLTLRLAAEDQADSHEVARLRGQQQSCQAGDGLIMAVLTVQCSATGKRERLKRVGRARQSHRMQSMSALSACLKGRESSRVQCPNP